MLGRHDGREAEVREEARGGGEVDACGCSSFGDRSEFHGGTERKRAESESEDTNHGRVTDLRRLTGWPSDRRCIRREEPLAASSARDNEKMEDAGDAERSRAFR